LSRRVSRRHRKVASRNNAVVTAMTTTVVGVKP